MNARRHPDRTSAASWRRCVRPLLGAFLLLLLGWGSAPPAGATGGTISGPFGEVDVYPGETLNIVDGAQSSGSYIAVYIVGGTVNISGGSISAGGYGVALHSGTVNISGGSISGSSAGLLVTDGTASIYGGSLSGSTGVQAEGGTTSISAGTVSGNNYGIWVNGGTVTFSGGSILSTWKGVLVSSGTATISGGSITGSGDALNANGGATTITGGSISTPFGVYGHGGAVSIYGCDLALSDGQLTGTLEDGTPIDTLTLGLSTDNLFSAGACGPPPCSPGTPQITCPSNVVAGAAAGTCSATLDPGTATASDNCTPSLPVSGVRSDGQALTAPYPVGTTTITWTAANAAGSNSCSQTITVTDTEKPTITCNANLTVPATEPSGARVGFGPPTTSDNCPGVTAYYTPGTGFLYPLGTTTVTGTALDAAGNTATCSFTVTVQPRADVGVSQSASPSPVVSGSQLTYTITVANNGPQAAQGVALTDPLPAGASFVSATRSVNVGTLTTPKGAGSTVNWSIGTLTSGQSVTLTVIAKVSAKAGSTLTSTASVSSSSPVDPNSSNNSSAVSTQVGAKR